MLCRLWSVFHCRCQNLQTKIFDCTPHIIWEHSPPVGAVFIFSIWKCFQPRMKKEFWALCNFYLIWCTWLRGHDVVKVMECVPFFMSKSVHQNIWLHSPHKLRLLPTSRRNTFFIYFKILPTKRAEGILRTL